MSDSKISSYWLRTAASIVFVVAAVLAADAGETDLLPRVAPLSPAEALKSFKIADGFRMELVAAEPLVCDPVAMAFDEWGRLYVVEMLDYSEQDKEHLGRVRLLTDKDGDGKFDESTVFAEHLSWPTAIACSDGGVYVGAAPDIYYLKDIDGDGASDVQELVTTGFDRSNVQRLVNSFQWAPDNRIDGATSISNTEISVPGDAKSKLALVNRDFALDPRTRKMTPLTGGGQHGMCFNNAGDRFVCSNSDHLQAIVFEDRYLARNPYQAAPAARRSIATDGPQAEVFRDSPVEAWRIARTNMRRDGRARGPLEGGGRAAGYFTSATGITIYEGELWPEKFRGWAFVADVGSNLIHRKKLTRDGVTYRGERVDKGSEFITSTDVWFRPVQMAIGPEGALYVADMYREVIEHPNSLPPELKAQIDLTSGRDKGRIYRIVPTSRKPAALKPLGKATTAELVAALDHTNLWRRGTAGRLIYERQDAGTVMPLKNLVKNGKVSAGRIAALYALDGLSALTPEVLLVALGDAHPQVRRHAVRLSEKYLDDSAPLRKRVLALVGDDDLDVRFQLALSLGEMASPEKSPAIAQLLADKSANPDVIGACLSSIVDCAGPVLRELLANKEWLKTGAAGPTVSAIVKQIERQQRAEDLDILLAAVRSSAGEQPDRGATLVLGALGNLEGAERSPQLRLIREVQVAASRKAVDAAQRVLENESATAAERVAAVRSLKLAPFAEQRETLAGLLSPAQPLSVQTAALNVLASYDSPQVASVLLAGWQQFSPELRRQAVEIMSQREAWLKELLSGIQRGEVPAVDIEPSYWATWSNHPSSGVRKLQQQTRPEAVSADRRAVFEKYRSVLTERGDAARGKEVFTKNCASCHRLEEVGHELAPSLAAMTNRGAESILYNILAPNAEVDARYISYVVTTTEGRVLTGIIDSETANAVRLRAANNETHDILRVDIDEMRSSGLSLMPEGLEQMVDKAAMADLLAYLEEATKPKAEDKK